MTRGIILFAFNNEELDYTKMAICCSLAIKYNMENNNVTLVTDEGSIRWAEKTHADLIGKAFDNIIISDVPIKQQRRQHFDSPWVKFDAEFRNSNRHTAYNLSPYDETLLIDVDYLVMDDKLDMVWGLDADIMANKIMIGLQRSEERNLVQISKKGIPTWWATVVFFRKSEIAKTVFDVMSFVEREYKFYKMLYDFESNLFRNDYALSVAAHMVGGFMGDGILPLPVNEIFFMNQKDTICAVQGPNDITFYSHTKDEDWRNVLVNVKDSVHIMNKRELVRVSDRLIEVYQ